MRSFLVLASVLVAASTSCSSGLNPFVDSVSYRPPTATVDSAPSCLAENIYTDLTGFGPWDPALTSDASDTGYPPVGFEPVAVIRCERGTDDAGLMTVDTVRLEGNIDAVYAAFSAKSERFPDGVMASCAYAMTPPAGLWFVDDADEVFRPAWPASPCGLQNAPMEALAAHTEVSRVSHPTGYNDQFNTVCESSPYGYEFDNTTPEDVAAAEEREQAPGATVVPSLVMPIDDVDKLRLCKVPTSTEQPLDSSGTVVGHLTTLSREDSASIVRSVADAPFAPACDRRSTRVASTELRRPDGSVSTVVSFELDGCQRAAGFGYYRAIPADALSTLTRNE